MDKNKAEITFTIIEKDFKEIAKLAELKNISITQAFTIALKKWHENNQKILEGSSEESGLRKCNIRIDKETEAIYKLFIEDCMKNLIEYLR